MHEAILARYLVLPAILFGVLGLAALALGRRRAALRQRIVVLGFGASLALPLLVPLLPRAVRWSLPVEALSSWRMETPGAPPEAAPATSRSPSAPPAPEASPAPGSLPAAAAAGGSAPAGAVPRSPARASDRSVPVGSLLLAFGILGGLLVSSRQLGATLRLSRVFRRAARSPEISRQSEALGHRLGLRRPVSTVLSDEVGVPVTWGCLRPRIALPTVAADWPARRREIVLLHELAHVRRRDALALWVLRLTRGLYWWNPLVWWLSAQARGDAEVASDSLVLDCGFEAGRYARELVAVLRSMAAGRAAAVAVSLGGELGLQERIEILFRQPRSAGLPSPPAGRLAVATILLCTGVLGSARLSAEPGPQGRDEASPVLTVEAVEPWPDPGLTPLDASAPDRPAPPPENAAEAAVPGARGRAPAEPRRRIEPEADSVALAALVAALSDGDPDVRRSAAGALRETGDEAARSALRELLDDLDPDVRRAAEMTLGLHEHVSIGKGFEPTRWVPPEPRPGEVEAAIAALGDGSERERREAADRLGNLRPAAAAPALVAALGDEAWQVRMRAVSALANLGDPAAAPAVLPLLRDPEEQVRQRAASALGNLGDPAAVTALTGALDDPDEHVRQAAAGALGRIGDRRALPHLISALEDRDEHVRRVTAEALGDLGDPSARAALAAATRDPAPDVRRSAVGALGDLLRAAGGV